MKRIALMLAVFAGIIGMATPASASPFVFDETQCYISGQSWTGSGTWSSHGKVSVRLDNGKRYTQKDFFFSDGNGGYKGFNWNPPIYGLAEYDGSMTLTITTQGRADADIAWGNVGCVKQKS